MAYSEWKNVGGEIVITNVRSMVSNSTSNGVTELGLHLDVSDYEKLEIGTLSYNDCAYYTPNSFIGTRADGTKVEYSLNSVNDISDIKTFDLYINAIRKNTTWGRGTMTLSFIKMS